MSEWISVKDKMPPKNKDSLLCNHPNTLFIVGRERCGTGFEPQEEVVAFRCSSGGGRFYDVITHWMPLPEPPK